jgi:hypothetical protein
LLFEVGNFKVHLRATQGIAPRSGAAIISADFSDKSN